MSTFDCYGTSSGKVLDLFRREVYLEGDIMLNQNANESSLKKGCDINVV